MWFASKSLFIQVSVNEITLQEPCCTTTKLKIQGPPLSTTILRQNEDTVFIQQSNSILSVAQEETQYRPIIECT